MCADAADVLLKYVRVHTYAHIPYNNMWICIQTYTHTYMQERGMKLACAFEMVYNRDPSSEQEPACFKFSRENSFKSASDPLGDIQEEDEISESHTHTKTDASEGGSVHRDDACDGENVGYVHDDAERDGCDIHGAMRRDESKGDEHVSESVRGAKGNVHGDGGGSTEVRENNGNGDEHVNAAGQNSAHRQGIDVTESESGSQNSQKESDRDRDEKWLKFEASLKKAGYYRSEMEGSKLYRELRVKAKEYYDSLTRYVWYVGFVHGYIVCGKSENKKVNMIA